MPSDRMVIDQVGRLLGEREFPATPVGYRALLGWLREHGELGRVGVAFEMLPRRP